MNEEIAKLLRQAYLHTFKMEIHEIQNCLGQALALLEDSDEKQYL
jgi:hypothetical protein